MLGVKLPLAAKRPDDGFSAKATGQTDRYEGLESQLSGHPVLPASACFALHRSELPL